MNNLDEALNELFISDGYKYITNVLLENRKAIAALLEQRTTTDADIRFLQGRLAQIDNILNFQTAHEMAKKQAVEEAIEDADV